VASHHRQVGHAHLTIRHDRHAHDARRFVREARADVGAEAPVDLLDDLDVARQQAPQQFQRPALERLRQNGVVRVREDGLRQLPGVLPAEPLAVDQDPHQLGDRERGMRVVELDLDRGGPHGS
jgi:hypothetical protein